MLQDQGMEVEGGGGLTKVLLRKLNTSYTVYRIQVLLLGILRLWHLELEGVLGGYERHT